MIAPLGRTGVNARGWVGLAAVTAVLCGSPPAHAALITRDVNVTLNAANIESYDLDVNLDGIIDFTFTAALVLDPFISVGFDVVDFPFGGNNGVVIDRFVGDGFPTVSFLNPGDTVSAADLFSSASFDQGNLFFFTTFDPPSGNFLGRTGFVGLRFDTPGGTVFGFAEVTVNDLNAAVNPLGLTIGRVGFNDAIGQPAQIPIGAVSAAVPEPASVVVVVLGCCALVPVVRRRAAV